MTYSVVRKLNPANGSETRYKSSARRVKFKERNRKDFFFYNAFSFSFFSFLFIFFHYWEKIFTKRPQGRRITQKSIAVHYRMTAHWAPARQKKKKEKKLFPLGKLLRWCSLDLTSSFTYIHARITNYFLSEVTKRIQTTVFVDHCLRKRRSLIL